MRAINWLDFKPTDVEIEALAHEPGQSVHMRLLVRELVRSCLATYPWQEREDLLPLFDPSAAYQVGNVVTLLLVHAQEVRPDSWRVGTVQSVEIGENSVQGKFQVVQIIVDGKEQRLAARLEQARPFTLCIPSDAQEMDMLVDEIANHYFAPLSRTIDELITQKKLSALLQGDQALFGIVTEIKIDFKSFFDNLPAQQPYLTTDEVILNLFPLTVVKTTVFRHLVFQAAVKSAAI